MAHATHGRIGRGPWLPPSPPRPQAALQQFLKADGNAQFIDGVADPSIKVLCCQTYVLMANARLQDAEEARVGAAGVGCWEGGRSCRTRKQ